MRLSPEVESAACLGSVGGDMNAWESYWCVQCNSCCLCHGVAVAFAKNEYQDPQTYTGGQFGQGVLTSSQRPAPQSYLFHFIDLFYLLIFYL